MRKKLFIAAPLVFIAGMVALWQVGNSRSFQFMGEIVPRLHTSEKVVALTFDDGPTKSATDEILKTLDEMNVKATFFVVGAELEHSRKLR